MYKSGFVAVMGRPNVGKSTLVNSLLEQKIAPVSPKPQTTRKCQMGILSLDNAQIIFEDTPGVHEPHHKLGEWMNEHAMRAFQDADVILFIVDVSQLPCQEDENLAQFVRKASQPVILVLNKADLLHTQQDDSQHHLAYQTLVPNADVVLTSAVQPSSLEVLLTTLLNHLPEHEAYYPMEQTTDWYEREIAAELIREAALNHLQQEVPHSIAVRVSDYTERGEGGAFIVATLFVERDSQKAIVIGQGGAMLKKIGTAARHEIERMSGRKVYLELNVRLRKNWRNSEKMLKALGYEKP